MNKIKVVVVDDSALVRKLLSRMLDSDPGIEVVGTAADPYQARDRIKETNPDVLTLDVEMPKMDGITFLQNLMRLRPMPVVMVSSLTHKGAQVTLQAMELGAVDFVTKPGRDLSRELEDYAREIIDKVKAAAQARVRPLDTSQLGQQEAFREKVQVALREAGARQVDHVQQRQALVAVGASTGGTEAIRRLLMTLPPDAPPVVLAQHIPDSFSGPFAERLDAVSAVSVRQASDGDAVLSGHALLAPGDRHMEVVREGSRLVVRLTDTEPVNRHRPSVDVLFNSVASACGREAVGVLLTGMGQDGARGLLRIREAGARTLVQDEASSVVWGMPKAALDLGAAEEAVDLEKIAEQMLKIAAEQSARS